MQPKTTNPKNIAQKIGSPMTDLTPLRSLIVPINITPLRNNTKSFIALPSQSPTKVRYKCQPNIVYIDPYKTPLLIVPLKETLFPLDKGRAFRCYAFSCILLSTCHFGIELSSYNSAKPKHCSILSPASIC
jgi:hypothetical protein